MFEVWNADHTRQLAMFNSMEEAQRFIVENWSFGPMVITVPKGSNDLSENTEYKPQQLNG